MPADLNLIVQMEFGSKVYGTSLPTSDVDVKGLYLPTPNQILLQNIPAAINYNSKKGSLTKNSPDDLDEEYYSLQKYIDLLLEGQTVALDMLFVPKENLLFEDKGVRWGYIQKNKARFLHKGYSSFVGYCRTQANKYGIKGSRLDAITKTLDLLKMLSSVHGGLHAKLNMAYEDLIYQTSIMGSEFVGCVQLPNSTKTGMEPYLSCCNRKVPFHASFKYAIECYQKIYDIYGSRARLAQTNEGVDWKALMHAVRIAQQAQELLLTHNVIFPRPNADFLLQIRKGELPYQQVAELIEQGLQDIETASSHSTLPEKPDEKFAQDLVYNFHREVVVSG